mgnify:FL=1
MISVGASFPDFNLTAVNSNNEFIQVSNNFSKGSWSVVYFYPKDFTFICPTEIVQMDTLLEEAEVLGISGDNEYCKLAWKEKDKELGKIKHSLAADRGLKLSTECGIVDHSEFVSLRATFIINPEGIIESLSCNHLDTGRSASEILRTIRGLKAGGLTGCSWQPGEAFADA